MWNIFQPENRACNFFLFVKNVPRGTLAIGEKHFSGPNFQGLKMGPVKCFQGFLGSF